MIDATDLKSQGFPHAEYWGMTYFGGFRMAGMKNPGYKGNTFVGRVYPTCISYAYEPSTSTDVTTPDADDNATLGTESGPVVPPSSDEAAPADAAPAAPRVAAASAAAAPATTTPAVAATTVPAVGGRKSRKHSKCKKGNKRRRVSRRKHRKSHARRHY